jgi:plasmid stabilization system protein ParE
VNYTVRFHRLAIRELIGGKQWYAQRNPQAAIDFISSVYATVALIEGNPGIGTISSLPYRWTKVGRFPYLLHYGSISPIIVMVYAVAHGSRRPGYSKRRINIP